MKLQFEVIEMFDYLKDSKIIKKRLSEYVSKNIVFVFNGKHRELVSPLLLNAVDRYILANEFIKAKPWGFEDVEDKEQLIKDIAIYIDYMIPKAYEKYYNLEKWSQIPVSQVRVLLKDHGLIYKINDTNNIKLSLVKL